MTWTFDEDSEGLIVARTGGGHDGLDEALKDAVGSRAPQGHPEGLSTYWVDSALAGVALAKPGESFLSGNSTTLVRSDEGVAARSLYQLFDDDEIPLDEFVSGMESYRRAIEAAIQHANLTAHGCDP